MGSRKIPKFMFRWCSDRDWKTSATAVSPARQKEAPMIKILSGIFMDFVPRIQEASASGNL
jgi:hypothetical protein